jgi:hypothetical protein
MSYAKAWPETSTRQVSSGFPYRKQTLMLPLQRDAGMRGRWSRIELAREMHGSVWHRPVGAGAREQVTNWMNSCGHVPRPYIENNNRETTGRHRAGRWNKPLMIGGVLLMLPLASYPGQARDPDGRYANSPLKQWFDSLRSGKGPCCSDADGSAVSDVDWESKGGRYRVRIDGEWHEVPDDAVITEPNRVGRTMVWPIRGYQGLSIRCFMPGSMT